MIFNKKKGILLALGIIAVGLIVSYRYSAKRIELFGHYDKVWAHRINDLSRLKSSQFKFKGIEMDLVYIDRENRMDVNHPPAISHGLSFKDVVNNIKNPDLHLWLDIKNLKHNNSKAILALLEKTLNSSFYKTKKNHIIIESTDVTSLHIFKEQGYRTSLYLANDFQQLQEKTNDSIFDLIENLQRSANFEISSNYKNYPKLKERFPKMNKNFWMLTSTYDIEIIKNFSLIRSLLKDSTVSTVLIPYINFNKHFTNQVGGF